ncbi:MAG TPA: hypothetical protein VEA59_07300 [Patescibacteria group bacterium]|nr:hypothetical protein [Patescibacteria group bacterium]
MSNGEIAEILRLNPDLRYTRNPSQASYPCGGERHGGYTQFIPHNFPLWFWVNRPGNFCSVTCAGAGCRVVVVYVANAA